MWRRRLRAISIRKRLARRSKYSDILRGTKKITPTTPRRESFIMREATRLLRLSCSVISATDVCERKSEVNFTEILLAELSGKIFPAQYEYHLYGEEELRGINFLLHFGQIGKVCNVSCPAVWVRANRHFVSRAHTHETWFRLARKKLSLRRSILGEGQIFCPCGIH